MKTIFSENFSNISTVKNIILHCKSHLNNAFESNNPDVIKQHLKDVKMRIENALSYLDDASDYSEEEIMSIIGEIVDEIDRSRIYD